MTRVFTGGWEVGCGCGALPGSGWSRERSRGSGIRVGRHLGVGRSSVRRSVRDRRTTTNGIDGKVALVTGAASGIGREIAVRFGAEGAAVRVVDVDESGGEETVGLVEDAGGRRPPSPPT
jgi:hypothetical protein